MPPGQIEGGKSSLIVTCDAGHAPNTFPAHGAFIGHWSFGSIFHHGPTAPSGGFGASLLPSSSNSGGKETTSHVSCGQYRGNHFIAGMKYFDGKRIKSLS
jgi:hypothetical protein